MSRASRQLALLLCCWCVAAAVPGDPAEEGCPAEPRQAARYVAAVYEHRSFLSPDPLALTSREQALELMHRNLDVYEQQVTAAARKARRAQQGGLVPGGWSPTTLLGNQTQSAKLKESSGSVQFSHSVMSDSLGPHRPLHARPPCPSPTPGVHPNSCPLSECCHPTISSSVVLFSSHLHSFPASGSFPMRQFFTSGGQSIGVSASASVLLVNIKDWASSGG